jgi:hypothetical protein
VQVREDVELHWLHAPRGFFLYITP